MRIQNLVIKTSGSIFDEFRQMICGHVLHSKIPKVGLHFILSDTFKSDFEEYFGYRLNTIEISDITGDRYIYDPANQDALLNKLIFGEEQDSMKYFIYEPTRNEFKRNDIGLFSYLKVKKMILNEIKESIHDYVHPQLQMLYRNDRINVALLYDPALRSEVYAKCCKPELFNYIDFSSDSTLKKEYINQYKITDDFLLFIALVQCDVVIGSWNPVSYTACCDGNAMLYDVSKNSSKVTDAMIPVQTVFNQSCWFPNTQILVEFL